MAGNDTHTRTHTHARAHTRTTNTFQINQLELGRLQYVLV